MATDYDDEPITDQEKVTLSFTINRFHICIRTVSLTFSKMFLDTASPTRQIFISCKLISLEWTGRCHFRHSFS